MAILSFMSMYVLMYSMVDRPENIHPSFNQFYMAGLMTAPMIVIELVLMKAMYRHKILNAVIIIISIIAGIIFFSAIRQQAAALVKTGLNPRVVGEQVLAAIRDERFYILTHPELNPAIELRMKQIVHGSNPLVR